MRNPFIAGSWVRGSNFFGRSDVLRDVLEGERDSMWAVGARRMGKTSLLKELEYRVQQNAHSPFVPLYWDLQGSADTRGLADGLLGSVEDSESFRRATDISPDDMEGMPVAEMLTTLVRRTVRSGWRLLLLVDEGEELLTIARNDPSAIPRLRRVLQKGPELRTVLTSTRRLARVDEIVDIDTSPFLLGFIPPLYLTPLRDGEARTLLDRGGFTEEENRLVMERTGNHPFLLQLLASRLFENRDLMATLDQLAADEMVANFFSVDFQTLETPERTVLEEVARNPARSRAEIAAAMRLDDDMLDGLLHTLRMLGYLGAENGQHRLSNWFFERWLRRGIAARASEVRPA
jgi:hypothetical protein